MTADSGQIPYELINGPVADPYQPRVAETYSDATHLWQDVIGPGLWFQFGVYGQADMPAPQDESPESLDASGRRHLERQLDIAGLNDHGREPERILDVGFGWGTALEHLARRFPHCPRLDGVNISLTQTEYAARRTAALSLAGRVKLYLCNAQDLWLLPDPEQPYDLVLMRGSITHFSAGLLDATLRALASRMSRGGTLVISESLYNIPLQDYTSALPDDEDRLACGHRKTLNLLADALMRNSFMLQDARRLPTDEDVIHWLQDVRANIERVFPREIPKAFRELRDTAVNLTAALHEGTYSVYSIIASR
ncbi:methyltransferase domain-containing protein [Kitasatospora sp. NPDC088351]|uniref:SAM-dependent methyltransferase n=1 Tax=Kitasatospora sp. NPDC088351 TaxID=3155180 RepID=UPI00342903E3